MAVELTIRPMTTDDLPAVGRWLREPHVARWFLPESTADAQLEKYQQRVADPLSTTTMCMVELRGQPVGWCQWYGWDDYPEDAASVGAHSGEVGADYAIGELEAIGHGVGTAMICELVAEVRRHREPVSMVIAPEAANRPSRRVLEKNGFELVGVRPLPAEPHDRPMAIYRLPSA